MAETLIRSIQPAHNPALALIIRNTLSEFGANKIGTVYYDPTPLPCTTFFKNPAVFTWWLPITGMCLWVLAFFHLPACLRGFANW